MLVLEEQHHSRAYITDRVYKEFVQIMAQALFVMMLSRRFALVRMETVPKPKQPNRQ